MQMDYEDIDDYFEARKDEMDIYSLNSVDSMMDNDEISGEEAAFMNGYNEAS